MAVGDHAVAMTGLEPVAIAGRDGRVRGLAAPRPSSSRPSISRRLVAPPAAEVCLPANHVQWGRAVFRWRCRIGAAIQEPGRERWPQAGSRPMERRPARGIGGADQLRMRLERPDHPVLVASLEGIHEPGGDRRRQRRERGRFGTACSSSSMMRTISS